MKENISDTNRFNLKTRTLVPLFLTCLLLPAILFTQSCTSVQEKQAPQSGPVFFPQPPDTARVQYLGSLSSPRDLPRQRSRFAEFVLGPEPELVALAKPNAAVMAGTQLYVCDTVFNTIIVFDLATGEARQFTGDTGNGKIRQPNNIQRDEEGNLYVADKLREAVLVYGPDEQFKAAWGRVGQCNPVDVAIGTQELYVCDIKDHEIEVWSRASGEFLRAFGSKGNQPGQFYMPSHVALDPNGNLLVTDTGNFRVQKLTPAGKPLLQFGGHGDSLGKFAWPKGIDVDGHGRIYVADSRFYNIQIFNPAGKLLLFFGGPGPGRGNVELPAGITLQPWPADVPWLASKLASGFVPEYLAIVVSQQGGGFINFFAIARETPAAQ